MRFAIVAGEVSGDILGASLIDALRAKFPQATFYGVAGPRMTAAGCEAIESIDALSVMGIAEVVKVLPRLFKLRADLLARFLKDRPDCIIGIDAPDFNLGLEKRLRAGGLKTVHYVSPTVWAWRQGRVKGIARAADLILCLFPFEPKFYQAHQVCAAYVGHPLADELDDSGSASLARAKLGLDPRSPCIAVLPGSRGGELKYLAEPFAQTVSWLHQRVPDLQVVVPIAKPKLRAQMEQAIAAHAPHANWKLLEGQSRDAMRAADAVLLASGTATLECLLLGRPMVASYKTSWFTAALVRKLIKVNQVSLPNLLCNAVVVPELLQEEARAELIGPALLSLLQSAESRQAQLQPFAAVRAELRRNAATRSADAIATLLQS